MLTTVKHFAFQPLRDQQIANIRGMRNKEIRLERLRLLVAEAGGVQMLATASGVSAEYLQQIIDRVPAPNNGPPRNLGDKNAKKLEEGCRKPEGWMDLPLGETRPEENDLTTTEISALFLRLPASSQSLALAIMKAIETHAATSQHEPAATTKWNPPRARNRTAPKKGNVRLADAG